jgi:hypothetical protein
MEFTEEQSKRFWAKVNKKADDECWEWLAGKNSRGYGAFKLNKKTVTASRISWSLLNGEISSDIFVCHSCDNPSCVNPNHLFVSNNQGNVDDMIRKKRHQNQVKTHCKNGHEFTETNTYRYKGCRACRECERVRRQRVKATRSTLGE